MRCTFLTRWSMAFTVDIIHVHVPSNKNASSVTAKEDKSKAVLICNIAAKGFIRAVHQLEDGAH